jgi:hypothetical protein
MQFGNPILRIYLGPTLFQRLSSLTTVNWISYIKGKSAIAVARQFGGGQRNFKGEQFWARGLQFQRLGLREEQIRSYI